MELENFDTDFFIQEVEKRPELWDIDSLDYTNRKRRRQCWDEIVEAFGEPGDSKEKKTAMCVTLQRKWKGLRDCFVRERKKGKNTGPGASKTLKYKPHFYFNRLMFLERSVRNKSTDSNSESSGESTDADEDSSPDRQDGVRRQCQPTRKKKRKERDEEETPMSSNLDSENDRLFCLSLHKELCKVPESIRLQTKIEIMNVILNKQQISLSHTKTSPENINRHDNKAKQRKTKYSRRKTHNHNSSIEKKSSEQSIINNIKDETDDPENSQCRPATPTYQIFVS